MTRLFSLISALPLLVGCATSGEIITALEPARDMPREVRCEDPCTDEWQRAQFWIATYSSWKIQTSTDVLIQTFNSSDDSTYRGFTVTREPVGGGEYVIRLGQGCDNFLGCASATDIEVEQAFLYYVQTGTDLVRGLYFRPD